MLIYNHLISIFLIFRIINMQTMHFSPANVIFQVELDRLNIKKRWFSHLFIFVDRDKAQLCKTLLPDNFAV